MQSCVGILLFSVLLTTGATLECETCTGPGENCVGPLQTCQSDQDVCVVALTKVTTSGGVVYATVKQCQKEEVCDSKTTIQLRQAFTETFIRCPDKPPYNTKFEFSKALSAVPSFFLSLSGLLLIKLLL